MTLGRWVSLLLTTHETVITLLPWTCLKGLVLSHTSAEHCTWHSTCTGDDHSKSATSIAVAWQALGLCEGRTWAGEGLMLVLFLQGSLAGSSTSLWG